MIDQRRDHRINNSNRTMPIMRTKMRTQEISCLETYSLTKRLVKRPSASMVNTRAGLTKRSWPSMDLRSQPRMHGKRMGVAHFLFGIHWEMALPVYRHPSHQGDQSTMPRWWPRRYSRRTRTLSFIATMNLVRYSTL